MNHFLRRLCLLAALCVAAPAALSAEATLTAVGNTTATVSVQLCYEVQLQGSWTGDIVLERQSPTATITTAWGTVRTFNGNFEGQGGQTGEAFSYRLRAGPTFAGTANVRINTVGSACKPGDYSVAAVAQLTADPCQSPAVPKSSVAIANTVDAELIAAATSKTVYVCGFNFTLNGTAPTARFITGTGAVCATGLTAKTGVIAPSIGLNVLSAGGGYTVFAGAAGAALCINVGGTTPSAQGLLTYIQQ